MSPNPSLKVLWTPRLVPLLFALLCTLAGPAAAQRAAIVSATAGEPSSSLRKGSSVAEGEPISTGAAENMALVLEDDALLELCARSVVTLRRHAVRKAQIVKLDAGEARFVVSPRSPDDRIEVHTPSAIATILGTIVVVKVDPETGETTVSSEEHEVEVRSSDPKIAGRTRVAKGEQCVVTPGEAPGKARTLPAPVFATLGECLMDLENSALAQDRIARRKRDLEKLAMSDARLAALPQVATITPSPSGPNTSFWPADPGEVLTPTSGQGQMAENPAPMPPPVTPPIAPPIPPPCNVGACTPGFP